MLIRNHGLSLDFRNGRISQDVTPGFVVESGTLGGNMKNAITVETPSIIANWIKAAV